MQAEGAELMQISIISAVSQNHVIGKNNSLIWHLPADMKFFKEKTTGHCVITGRKNYESIPEKFRPLPNRTNIVVTRNKNFSAPGAEVVNTLEEAIALAKSKNETEVFIIGGGQIYSEAMEKNLADTLYITEIHHAFEGDTFFPVFDKTKWKEVSRITVRADEKNKYDFDFVTYTR